MSQIYIILHPRFLLISKSIFKKVIQYFGGGGGGIITWDPSICKMDHPDLTVSNLRGNSIGPKRVKMLFSQVNIGY